MKTVYFIRLISLMLVITLVSANIDIVAKIPKIPTHENEENINQANTKLKQGAFQELQVLGIKRIKGGTFIYPSQCCICCCEPCPCKCGLESTDPFIKINDKDIINSVELTLKDGKKNKLTLFTIRTNDPVVLKEAKNYDWMGLAHNTIVSKTLDEIDKQILAWKKSKKRPGRKEIEDIVENVLIKSYKEIGFSNKQLLVMQKVTNEILTASRKPELSKSTEINNILKSLDAGVKADVIAKQSVTEESKLNSRFSKMEYIDFAQNKAAFSILRASNEFWSRERLGLLYKKYTGKLISDAIYNKVYSEVLDADVKGLVSGGIGGALAGAGAGGIGAGPGSIVGGVAGSAGGSLGQGVVELLDWIF